MNKIIFSPHVDDSMFSLGGAIIAWINQGLSVRVINVFSNGVSSKGLGLRGDDETRSRVRIQDEQTLVAEHGKIFEYLDYKSSGGRGSFLLRKLMTAKQQTLLGADAKIKKIFEEYLNKLGFGDECEVYIPLVPKLHAHVDHLIVRNACLRYFSKQQQSVKLYLYEELPYCNIDKSYESYMSELDISSELYQIDYKKKVQAISAYQTELRSAWKANIEKQFLSLGGERVWLLNSLEKKRAFLNF